MNAQLEKVSWDGALLPSSARHPFKLVMYSGGMRLHVLTSWANPPLTGAWLFADDRMFSRYHSCLCETLARLGFALHMAITNKPLTEVESPSSVHAELKTLVNRIIRDAVTLPNFKVIERKMSNEERLSEDIDIKTYEDILATAILNKRLQALLRQSSAENWVLWSQVYRPRYLRCICRNGQLSHRHLPKSRLEIGVSESGSVEDCDGISRGDGSWSESSHTEPISLTVEECIEEVTTYNSSEEEEAVGPEDHSGGSELDFYLSGLNFIQRHRVPFPELGMDIIDGAGYESNESGEDDEAEGKVSPKPTDLYTPIESWEENWLFQKRRLKSNSGANQSVPVPMLVPNPSEDYRALIDTPEGGCGGSSEEYSSLQDGAPELAEATNNELFKASSVDCLSEFGQQDSEYTEDYAAVTQRQMSSLMLIDESEAKPISKPRSLGVPPQLKVNGESSTENQKADHLESIDSQIEIELATPPKPGTDQSDDCMLPQLESDTLALSVACLPTELRVPGLNLVMAENVSLMKTELPDFHNEQPLVKHPTSPLKVVCTGSELDTKRYGRDYYVNSKLPKDETKQNTKLAALEELLLSSGNPQQPKSSNTGARQVSGGSTLSLTSLEEEMLQRDIYHSSFRAHNASPNFMMNPLYEGGGNMDEERDQLQEHKHLLSIRRKRLRPESGYSSSLDSIASEPLILLRLTPPLEPQMVERSFESLSSLRRAASLKGKGTRSKSKSPLLGGSLRSRKQIREDVTSALW
uniref:Uncharacterized protein n=1 Tax=Timema monikensis TaxID=170555 RepID=A0A7R9EF35_9NEOP|nr:unnamed protein product [Timema monikensis]